MSDIYLDRFNEFLDAARSGVDNLRIMRRVIHRYPFDTIANALWIKTLNTGRAVSALLSIGLEHEAYAMSRGVVEIAYTLRYITHKPELQFDRTMRFVRFSKKDRELWLALTLKQNLTPDALRGIERLAALNQLTPDDRSAHSHWSGEARFPVLASGLDHPLDTRSHDKDEDALNRACDYYHPSVFLHASCAGSESLVDLYDDAFCSEPRGPGKPYFVRRATVITFLYTQHVLNYALYGMNIGELAPSLSMSRDFLIDVDADGLPVIGRAGSL